MVQPGDLVSSWSGSSLSRDARTASRVKIWSCAKPALNFSDLILVGAPRAVFFRHSWCASELEFNETQNALCLFFVKAHFKVRDSSLSRYIVTPKKIAVDALNSKEIARETRLTSTFLWEAVQAPSHHHYNLRLNGSSEIFPSLLQILFRLLCFLSASSSPSVFSSHAVEGDWTKQNELTKWQISNCKNGSSLARLKLAANKWMSGFSTE